MLQIHSTFSDTNCLFSSKRRFPFVPFQSSGRLAVEKNQNGNTLLISGLTKQDQVTRQYCLELFIKLLNITNIALPFTFRSNLPYFFFVILVTHFFQAVYTCSVSAFKRTEVKHSLRVRGGHWAGEGTKKSEIALNLKRLLTSYITFMEDIFKIVSKLTIFFVL